MSASENNIYNSELSVANQTNSSEIDGFISIAGIIENIQQGSFREEVEDIRAIINDETLSDDEKEKQSKAIKRKSLGMFYPSVYLPDYKTLDANENWEATGIIQFDIDHIAEEKAHELKASISGYNDCLYAFISPRNGLKFAIYTDYKADSKENYATAYTYTSAIIQDRLNIELDDSMKSIVQGCYMSWDTEVFFNENVSELLINKSVLKLIIDKNTKEEKDRLRNENLSLSKTYEGTTADEIIKALSKIDKDLKFKEREAINFAVIDGLGVFDAKRVLMNHWSKADREKLEEQIDGYCKSFKKGQGITVATLFHHAKNNGYRKKTRLKVTDTDKEATFNEIRYSPKEAEVKLIATIDDFVINKESKVVNFEAGAGKSTRFREILFNKIIVGNLGKNVSIYVRSHETAEEYKAHFEELASRKDNLEGFKNKLDAKSDKLKLKLKVQHIKGRYQNVDGVVDENSYCKHELLISNAPEDKLLFDKHASKFCAVCKLREHCGYVEQFNSPHFYKQQVRIYTHQSLFTQSSLWDGGSYYDDDSDQFSINSDKFEADYIIIDEDILGNVFSSTKIEKSGYEKSCKSIQSIIHDIKHESLTVEQAIIKNKDLVKADFESQKELMKGNDDKYKNINFSGTREEVRRSHRGLKIEEVNYKKILKEMLLFIKASEVNSELELKHNGIQYDIKNEQLILFKTASIQDRFLKKPMLILDASADEKLWNVVSDKVLNKPFKFEQIRVNYSENVSVYQYANESYSKYSIDNNFDSMVDKLVAKITELSEGKKVGLITYQHLKSKSKFYQYLNDKVSGVVCGYFGDVRGLNSFNDCEIDQLFIIGRHSIGQGIDNQYRQLFSEITANDVEQDFIRADKEEVFRLKGDKNKLIVREHYHNEILVALDNHFNKGETYQAAHRLRLIHTDRKKELFIFTNEVLDLTLDEVILKDSVSDIIIRKMEKVIDDEGFIINKNKSIATAIDMKTEQIRDNRTLINAHFQDRETTEMGGYRNKTEIKKYVR